MFDNLGDEPIGDECVDVVGSRFATHVRFVRKARPFPAVAWHDAEMQESSTPDLYDRVAARFGDLLESCGAESWSAPSPCPVGPHGMSPRMACADSLIHTWGFARATDQDERLDPEGVAVATSILAPEDRDIRMPQAFGPKVHRQTMRIRRPAC